MSLARQAHILYEGDHPLLAALNAAIKQKRGAVDNAQVFMPSG